MGAGNYTGVTAADNAIGEVWSKQAQMATDYNLVMEKLADHSYQKELTFGDTIHVITVANLTASAKSEGTALTPQAGTLGTLPILINQHYGVPFMIEDIAQAQSCIDIMSKYTTKAGKAIAKKRDATLTALYANLTQSQGSGSVTMSDAHLIQGVVYLDNADAPEDERSLVVKPAVKGQLLGIDKITLFQNVGTGKAITDAKFGEIYGVTLYTSNNITTVAATPSVEHNLMFHKEAFAIVSQIQPKFASLYKPLDISTECVLSSLWGVAEMRDTFAVDMRTITTVTT